MRRKIFAALCVILATIGISLLGSGVANAAIIDHYGHRDNYITALGNVSCANCSDRAVRVGVELRTLGASTYPQQYDMNVCVDVLKPEVVARVSINTEDIIKDSTYFVGHSEPNLVGGNVSTFCADMDPNVGSCGPSQSSDFIAVTNVSLRLQDGRLYTAGWPASDHATMPCD